MMPSGPLSEKKQYEDKIMLDEIKRNMDNLVKDAEKKNIKVKTEYYSPEERKAIESWFGKDAPEYVKQARWSNLVGPVLDVPDPSIRFNQINIPRTPSLLNYLIASEEYEHALEPDSQDGPYPWYDEEKRAKPLAKKRVGGRFDKETEKKYDYGMKTYQDRLARDIIQDMHNYYDKPTATRSMTWRKYGTDPMTYAMTNYPEMKYNDKIHDYLAKRSKIPSIWKTIWSDLASRDYYEHMKNIDKASEKIKERKK